MKRILLAGVLGGLAAFLWSAFSHMALPLGETGVRSLPAETEVLGSLRGSVPEAGLYIFPSPADTSPEGQAQWMEKHRTGPVGLLVYRPVGGEFNFPRYLVTELLTNILAAALAAFFLARIFGGYLQRALLVAMLGLFAWLSISVSYWNWYDFPASFILAEGIDQVVGWFVAGLVIARVVPGRPVP